MCARIVGSRHGQAGPEADAKVEKEKKTASAGSQTKKTQVLPITTSGAEEIREGEDASSQTDLEAGQAISVTKNSATEEKKAKQQAKVRCVGTQFFVQSGFGAQLCFGARLQFGAQFGTRS